MYLIITNDDEILRMARLNGDNITTINTSYQPSTKKSLDSSISEFLVRFFGIPANIKGFTYLKYLLKYCVENPGYETESLCGRIYPECGKAFNSNGSRVERAIRHAIETSYENGNYDKTYEAIFGKLDDKPSNSCFIRRVAVYFRENLVA